MNYSCSSFNSHSYDSIQVWNFIIHGQFFLWCNGTSFKFGVLKLGDCSFLFGCKDNHQLFYTEFVLMSMTMTSPMTQFLYVPWVQRWLRSFQAPKCLYHMWCTWCQQRSVMCCMTEWGLRIRHSSLTLFAVQSFFTFGNVQDNKTKGNEIQFFKICKQEIRTKWF